MKHKGFFIALYKFSVTVIGLLNINPKLNELVNSLTEFYQPIYGHSEWDDKPLRSCEDRLSVFKKIYDGLSQALQRPLRVLDLGCAQGFFSLHIAKWGGVVTAVDFQKQNVALGEFLADEHPEYKITFVRDRVEEVLRNINGEEYDLVLCLSILHNVSRQIGLELVLSLVQELSKKITAGIFEFALEKVHSSYIPEDYRDFLPGFSFIRDLAYSDHRNDSGIKCPLCFASNRYAYFESLGMLKIDDVRYTVHPYLAKTDVVHFFCGDKFVKFFYLHSKHQQFKAEQEITFLRELGGENGLPRLLATHEEQGKKGKRLFIVRDKLDGISLAEKIKSGEEFDRWDTVKQILQWMIFFEKRNYYHGDARPQNFIYGEDGKIYPIDYEEIRHKPVVLIWPYRVHLLFLMLMNSILKPFPAKSGLVPSELQILAGLKLRIPQKQYEQILAMDDSENFFERLYKILFEKEDNSAPKTAYTVAELEFMSITNYFEELYRKNKRVLEQKNVQPASPADSVDSSSSTNVLNVPNKFPTARLDIKFIPQGDGDFQILSVSDNNASVAKPGWFQKNGIGYQIQSCAGKLEIVAKSTVNGSFNLWLKGINFFNPEDNSKRIPCWVNYTKLIVNGNVVLDDLFSAWHDKPYRYDMNDIKAGEEITIQVAWLSYLL